MLSDPPSTASLKSAQDNEQTFKGKALNFRVVSKVDGGNARNTGQFGAQRKIDPRDYAC